MTVLSGTNVPLSDMLMFFEHGNSFEWLRAVKQRYNAMNELFR